MAYDELRRDYDGPALHKRDCHPDPLHQFHVWMEEAIEAEIPMSNAMTLATVSPEGQPRSRIVLLKELDETGFVFYTNYESDKSRDLEHSNKVSLLFYWQPLARQVRIDGEAARVLDSESDAYFASRPRESNLSAMASRQSRPLANRGILERSIEQLSEEWQGRELLRPSAWGGYRVIPKTMEFWQGRPDRTHDRIEYVLEGQCWSTRRLYP